MYKVWECELCGVVEEGTFLPDGWLRIPQRSRMRDVYCSECLKWFPANILPEPGIDGTILVIDPGTWSQDVLVRKRLQVAPLENGFVCVESWEDDSIYIGE